MSFVSRAQTSFPWAHTCDEDIGSSRSVAASNASIVVIVCSRSSRIAPRTVAAMSCLRWADESFGGHEYSGQSHANAPRIYPPRRWVTSSLRRQLGHEPLDVRHDPLARGGIAVADRRHLPLIDALPPGGDDITAEAHDARRAFEVVERDRPRPTWRRRQSVGGQPLHGAGPELRVRLGPGRGGIERQAALRGQPTKV